MGGGKGGAGGLDDSCPVRASLVGSEPSSSLCCAPRTPCSAPEKERRSGCGQAVVALSPTRCPTLSRPAKQGPTSPPAWWYTLATRVPEDHVSPERVVCTLYAVTKLICVSVASSQCRQRCWTLFVLSESIERKDIVGIRRKPLVPRW